MNRKREGFSEGQAVRSSGLSFGLIDLLRYGRREDWQDSPDGWPRELAGNRWATSQAIAAVYGPQA